MTGKAILRSLTPPLLWQLASNLRRRQVDARIAIGNYTITLPAGHKLADYLACSRLYDRFLPILCAYITDPYQYIVDVGANVGDTACAIAQACQNPILCVEGDKDYFQLLFANINSLPDQISNRVKCVMALVGTGKHTGVLASNKTTASLKTTINGYLEQKIHTLDSIITGLSISPQSIALLKVDTDGYDGAYCVVPG